MNPWNRLARGPGMGRLGASGSSSGLPAVGMMLPQGVPADRGGSVVQGDGFLYTYKVLCGTIAAAAVNTITLQFDQVSVFKWVRSTAFSDLAGAAITSGARIVPLVTLKITDVGSGMSFMNNAVPIDNISGRGDLPYVLPTPQFILANAVLQFTFTNFSAATTYADLSFELQGYKLFNYQQGVPQ